MDDLHFTIQTWTFPPDDDGEVVATFLSSRANRLGKVAVLYIHGFTDYFFHAHVSNALTNAGYDFYALDLRKYGRSLRPHQKPNYCRNIREYDPEISQALVEMQRLGYKKIFVLGHSTGGLIAASYANFGKNRHLINGLILNSPFFALPGSPLKSTVIGIIAHCVSYIAPNAIAIRPNVPAYVKSIHQQFEGEWDFQLDWKPVYGFPVYFAWLAAVLRAQRELLDKGALTIPIFVLHATRSKRLVDFEESAKTADIILDVKSIANLSPKLGSHVTIVPLRDGMHDLYLSSLPVRTKALDQTIDWLNNLTKNE